MRGLRSFLVLLIVLIGLGAWLYFVESKRDPNASDRDKVFTVESNAIEEIVVRAESGERTRLRKSGDDWQIVEPVTAASDNAEVSGLTSNLSNLEVQSVVEENPGDLAEYGLATPRVEIMFKAGGQEHTLHVGNKTPPGTDLYAKRANEPRVFLIASYLDSTFNRTTFDLRDKAVLNVDRSGVDSMIVTTPERALRFAKAGTDWRLTAPFDARANFSAVDSLLSRVNTLQMKSIAAQDGANLAEYGLDKPAATVQLGSGSSQATLLVGKSAGDGVVYAKDQSKPLVVTVDASLLEELKKEPGAFRQNDLFDARAFNSTHLEFARGGQTYRFEKATVKNKDGQDEERWRQVAPEPKDVDTTKVEDVISAATQLSADSFVDSTSGTGLASPELTLTVRSDAGKRTETVRVARSGGKAFAAREGEGGAATLSPESVDRVTKAIEALLQPAAAPDAGKQ